MKRLFLSLIVALAAACGGPAARVAAPSDAPGAKAADLPAPAPLTPRVDAPSEESSPIPITTSDPVWGSRNALVTVVEFSDFQCPFCSRGATTIDRLKETYGPDQLRIVWKNEPLSFHENARPAAEFSQGVFALGGNDAFWSWHDAAFRGQSKMSLGGFTSWATQAGVNAKSVLDGFEKHTWADKIDKDHELAKQLGVNGTPAFFINGVSITGAQPFAKFQSVIDQEIKIAKALLEQGEPRDRLYVTVSAINHKNPPPAEDDDEPKEDPKAVFKVPVGQSPARGPATAQVTIIEFGDYECPYTRKVEGALTQLRAKYGDKIRIVWKDEPLPFHPKAEPAAQLAREVRAQKGMAAFWAVHDVLLALKVRLDDEELERSATSVKITAESAKRAMAAHTYRRAIAEDTDLADDFAASGTPHFFINGRRLVGAHPADKFEAIIDEEIATTDALLKSGVAKAKIYETRIKDGKGPAEPEKKTVALNASAPWKGSPTAKVVIQVFSDFQCPFCSRANPTMAEVLKEYGTRVKIVWRQLPLPMHHDAPMAAQASMEAYAQRGNDGFWKMHDLLFTNQGVVDGLKRPALDDYARQLSLDMGKWQLALDTQAHKPALEADARAASDANISGTPAFLVNGYFISGAQPYPKFRKLIERALADAAHR